MAQTNGTTYCLIVPPSFSTLIDVALMFTFPQLDEKLDDRIKTWNKVTIMSRTPDLSDVVSRLAEIDAKQSEIKAQIRQLSNQLRKLHSEEGELRLAESVLRRLAGEEVGDTPSMYRTALMALHHDIQEKRQKPISKPTTEDLILSLLRHHLGKWYTAAEVQNELSKIRGAEVPMSTISPTLTNMKKKGLIKRLGRRVAFADHEQEIETPSGDGNGPDGASEEGARSVD